MIEETPDADLRQSLILFRTENLATAALLSLIAKQTMGNYIPGHCLMLRAAVRLDLDGLKTRSEYVELLFPGSMPKTASGFSL